MFGLESVKDIVAATGDGTSVMVRFGNINQFEYNQCLNHGIHLAVVEVFYARKQIEAEENSSSSISDAGSYRESDDGWRNF